MPEASSWEAKLKRRHEFCTRFVREHHPGMANTSAIKGAHPLVPLDGPAYLRHGGGNLAADWWLQTDDSMGALGFVWLAHLFDREQLFDHAWMIGRRDQEPWALVSEPYVPPAVPGAIAALRREVEKVGTELLEYGAGLRCRRPPPTTDEPDAGVLPATSQRRHVGHGAVMRAVGPPGDRTAAKMKLRARRISARPAANVRGQRVDLFGSGQTWAGEGGCLGGRHDGLRRRRAWQWSAFGAACPGGGPRDLVNRHRPRSEEAEHDADAQGDAAFAILPAPDVPRADIEQLGDAALCNVERADRLAEFGATHGGFP
jgi:hypothetical protein